MRRILKWERRGRTINGWNFGWPEGGSLILRKKVEAVDVGNSPRTNVSKIGPKHENIDVQSRTIRTSPRRERMKNCENMLDSPSHKGVKLQVPVVLEGDKQHRVGRAANLVQSSCVRVFRDRSFTGKSTGAVSKLFFSIISFLLISGIRGAISTHLYKKYATRGRGGITRSSFGTASKIVNFRSWFSSIVQNEAELPHLVFSWWGHRREQLYR